MWLEDSSECVIIDLRDRIVFMVVTFGAVQGETEKCLPRVFDGGVKPSGPVEKVIITGQKPCGLQGFGVFWKKFVGSKHLLDHSIVTLVFVERLDDPVAPMPNVLLAIA